MFKKICLLLLSCILLFGCEMMGGSPSEPTEKEEKKEEPVEIIDDPKEEVLEDSVILDKDFTATLWNGNYASGEVTFHVNYANFLGDNTVYNREISLFGAALCNDLADDWITNIDGVEYQDKLHKEIIYNEVGFEDAEIINLKDNNYEVDANDTSRFAMAHYPIVKDNKKYEVVICNVCMTVGTAEWQSNLDIGADTANYYKYFGESHPDWKNKEHHKGFDVCANRITPYLNEYLNAKVEKDANIILFFTGYSRGAAIANILAANYTNLRTYKVFAYTYETPTTVCTANDTLSNYKNIFNICTSRDIIAKVPLASWGFKRYGVDIIKTVNATAYRNLTGAEFNCTSDDSFSNAYLLNCTRNEIYDKEIVIYDDAKQAHAQRGAAQTFYDQFVEAINKLNNNELFEISEIELVDSIYTFTIEGPEACFIEVLAYFIPNISSMDTSMMIELLTYMAMFDCYSPLFEDIIDVLGLGFDKIQIVNPHYLIACVSVILNY